VHEERCENAVSSPQQCHCEFVSNRIVVGDLRELKSLYGEINYSFLSRSFINHENNILVKSQR